MKKDKNIEWINVYSDNDIPDKHDRWQRKAIIRYGTYDSLQIGYVKRILETAFDKNSHKTGSKILYIPHFFVPDFSGNRKVFYKKEDQAKKAIEVDFYLFRDFIKSFTNKKRYCPMCEKNTPHRTVYACNICEKNL